MVVKGCRGLKQMCQVSVFLSIYNKLACKEKFKEKLTIATFKVTVFC